MEGGDARIILGPLLSRYAVKAAMYLGPGSSEVLAGVVQGLVHHGRLSVIQLRL